MVYHDSLKLVVEKRLANEIESGQVEINVGLSTEVLHHYPNEFFDWVYLDTAHTYEVTIAELNILKHKVKKGGLITGHDYVTGYWPDYIRYGVIEAVHELCVKEDWELLWLTNEIDQHRSFAISKIQ